MKKHRIRTRKGRALALACAVVLLLAAAGFTGAYNFLPYQALRAEMEASGAGRMYVAAVKTDAPENARIYLLANDRALMLAAVSFKPLSGWRSLVSGPMRRDEATSGCCAFTVRNGANRSMYLFGYAPPRDVRAEAFGGGGQTTGRLVLERCGEPGGEIFIAGAVQLNAGSADAFEKVRFYTADGSPDSSSGGVLTDCIYYGAP